MSPFRQLSELEHRKQDLLVRVARERADCVLLARRFRGPVTRVDRVLTFIRRISPATRVIAGVACALLIRRVARSPRLSFASPLLWRAARSFMLGQI